MKQRIIQLDVVTIKHQKIVTDSIVCRGFPHNQDGSEAWCHLTRLATHRPWPVRNLFSVDHRCRDGSKPGGQTIGSVMSDWLTTVILLYWTMHQPTQRVCLNTEDQPQITSWTPQMTADHYRSSNPNPSPNPNPNPNPNLNRSSAVICGVRADRTQMRCSCNHNHSII